MLRLQLGTTDIESCGIYEAGEDRYRLNFPRHGATLITDMSFTAVTVLENKERKTENGDDKEWLSANVVE